MIWDPFGDLSPYPGGQAPAVRGSDTSEAAARSVEPTAGSKRGTVLGLLRTFPEGLTDEQIEVATGWRHQTVSARRRELVIGGFVEDSGLRRKTSSGREAAIWVAR